MSGAKNINSLLFKLGISKRIPAIPNSDFDKENKETSKREE
jgi:hypothetical protein